MILTTEGLGPPEQTILIPKKVIVNKHLRRIFITLKL